MTKAELQAAIGVEVDGVFGPVSRAALLAHLSNPTAPRATLADITIAAGSLGVPVSHIRGVRTIEAPRGPFDSYGRPTVLYERHKFAALTAPAHAFDRMRPDLSGPPYGPGGYGPYAGQYDKLAMACSLDPNAALQACSWGAFQVMGQHAVALGYDSAWDMITTLTTGEAAHLVCFARYVRHFGLVDKFRACRPNDPASCRRFVAGYNGPDYALFGYDVKLAKAMAAA